jgi:uncharacterized membrane protein YdbT with pleckstrin-like domain
MSPPTPPQPPSGDAPTTPLRGGTAPLGQSPPGQQPAAPPRRRRAIPPWTGGPQPAAPAQPSGTPSVPTFRGQQPGETTIFIRRKHPIFLVLPLWPAALALTLFLALHLVHSDNVRLNAFIFLVSALLAVIFVVFLLKWLVVDIINWYFNIYILTNRRVMDAEGFFTPNRKEASLDRIQQVQIEQNNLFEFLFNIGDIQVYTAGTFGDLTFNRVAGPRQLADQIRQAEMNYRSSGRAPAAPIEPENDAVKRALDVVAQPVDIPMPTPAAQRTYGGFFRRPANFHTLDNEVIVNYIYRHWFVLVRREVFPALVLIGSLLFAGTLALALHTELWVIGLLGLMIGLIYAGLVYLNYIDDVFILTTDRVIDIDRFIFFFFEGRKQADYSKVQDVRVNVRTLVGRILNFGDIVVETAGRLPNIEMSDIARPFAVQDLIFARMTALKEREAAMAANRQRQESRRVIAGTMNEVLVEVPDVRRLSLLEAGEALNAAGLKLVVDAERPMRGVPPGAVVTQMPGPRATALRESEVYVIVSGRA